MILIVLLILSIPMYGQNITDDVTEIPKHETPEYHCFVGFFMLEVRMRNDNEDLSSLLEEMSLPDSKLLKHMMVRIVGELGQEEIQREYGMSPTFTGDYEQEQNRLAKAKIRWHKQLYDSFLDLVENEGGDRDSVHNYIISEGRDMAPVDLSGTGEYNDGYKEALAQFEGGHNPWLQ